MLLGGLWHGANWNFVIWGALHGVALAVHKFFRFKLYRDKPENAVKESNNQVDFDKNDQPPALPPVKPANIQLQLDFGFDNINNDAPPVKSVEQVNIQPQIDFDKKEKSNKYSFKHLFGVLLTFHFVMFAWIFFRNQSLDDCSTILSQIFTNFQPQILWQLLSGYKLVFVLIFAGYILHFTSSRIEDYCKNKFAGTSLILKVVIIIVMIYIIAQIKSGDVQPFIYFQF